MLVSIDWDEMFPNSHLRSLGSDASFHCPLLLHMNLGSMSRARFHFEIFWPKFDDWHGPTSSRGPLSQLNDRLRGLVKAL